MNATSTALTANDVWHPNLTPVHSKHSQLRISGSKPYPKDSLTKTMKNQRRVSAEFDYTSGNLKKDWINNAPKWRASWEQAMLLDSANLKLSTQDPKPQGQRIQDTWISFRVSLPPLSSYCYSAQGDCIEPVSLQKQRTAFLNLGGELGECEKIQFSYMDLLSQDIQQWKISWSGICSGPDESIHTQLSSRVPPSHACIATWKLHSSISSPVGWTEQNRTEAAPKGTTYLLTSLAWLSPSDHLSNFD